MLYRYQNYITIIFKLTIPNDERTNEIVLFSLFYAVFKLKKFLEY